MLRNVMMKVAKSSLNNAGHWVSFNICPKLTHSYTGLYNSFLYQTFIIHLAQSKGLGNEAEEAFFHAYMTEGLAIGEREVVEEIASRIGLDNAEVEYVLDSDELTDFVRHDEKIAREQLNITGVPFFVFDQKLTLSGAQPREIFLQAADKIFD